MATLVREVLSAHKPHISLESQVILCPQTSREPWFQTPIKAAIPKPREAPGQVLDLPFLAVRLSVGGRSTLGSRGTIPL
jgi:hypothetical protein